MPGKGAVPASDIVSKHVSNPIGKAAVNRIAEATGEGVEEVAENLVNPHIQQYTYGKQVNHNKVCSSLGEAFAGGALASLLLGVTGDVKNGIEAKRKNSIPPTQVNAEASQSAVSDTAFSNPSIADSAQNTTSAMLNESLNAPKINCIFDKKIGTPSNPAPQNIVNDYIDYSLEYSMQTKQLGNMGFPKQRISIDFGTADNRLATDLKNRELMFLDIITI